MPVYHAVGMTMSSPHGCRCSGSPNSGPRKGGRPETDPTEFMYMWRLTSRGSDLHLYKHCWTRLYINPDDAGHAYVFVRPSRARSKGPFGASICRPLRDLVTAIDRLRLEGVPVLPLADGRHPECGG